MAAAAAPAHRDTASIRMRSHRTREAARCLDFITTWRDADGNDAAASPASSKLRVAEFPRIRGVDEAGVPAATARILGNSATLARNARLQRPALTVSRWAGAGGLTGQPYLAPSSVCPLPAAFPWSALAHPTFIEPGASEIFAAEMFGVGVPQNHRFWYASAGHFVCRGTCARGFRCALRSHPPKHFRSEAAAGSHVLILTATNLVLHEAVLPDFGR
jgi:hypothetical protein